MHICVCVHVCIPACVFVYYVCVHIHVYMYRYVFICVYVFVCVYAWAYVYLYVCIYVYIHTSIYVYLYVYMYLYVCLYVHVYVCFYYVYEAITLLFPSLSCHKNPKQNRKPNKILLFPLHSYITWLFPLRVFRTFPWEMILKASGMRLHNPQTEGVRTLSPRSLWPGTAGSRILLSVPEPQITQT